MLLSFIRYEVVTDGNLVAQSAKDAMEFWIVQVRARADREFRTCVRPARFVELKLWEQFWLGCGVAGGRQAGKWMGGSPVPSVFPAIIQVGTHAAEFVARRVWNEAEIDQSLQDLRAAIAFLLVTGK